MFGRSICVRWDVYTVLYIMCEQKFNEREDTYNFINPSTNKNSTSLTANKTTFIFYYTTVHLNDEWKNCHMFCGTKCVKSVSSVNKICKTYGKYLPFPPYFFFTWPGVNYSNSTNLQQLACQCMYMYVSGQNIVSIFWWRTVHCHDIWWSSHIRNIFNIFFHEKLIMTVLHPHQW